MLVAYWIVAALLAAFYLYSGALKTVRSKEKLAPQMEWVDSMPLVAVRLIGIAEILGAVGLIVPPLTGVQPWLALPAAAGLALVQIGAIVVHLRRGDRAIAMNVVLLVLAGVTGWLGTVWVS